MASKAWFGGFFLKLGSLWACGSALWPEPGLEECQSRDEKGKEGNPKVSVAPGSSRGTSGELEARFGEAVHIGNLVCFLYFILGAG